MVKSRSLRRLAAALVAVGFVTATPAVSVAKPAPDAGEPCTEYGAVAKAPKGFIPRDDHQVVHRDPLAGRLASLRAAKAQAPAFEASVIPVHFHVIAKDRGNTGGDLSQSRIEAQIDVLNDAYAGSGFSFELVDVTRTYEPEWFNLISANGADPRYFRGSGKEVKMKQALHAGNSETLNVYTASLGQFLLGWAYLPWDFGTVNGQPLPQYFDGVVLDYRSLPQVPNDTGDSSAFAAYGEGDTATHEVGHWLGLFHTFDGGCSEPGDYVADTPAEASPAFQCPIGRDTCAAPGADPIHNFMDYTQDSCMFEFTTGQVTRMQTAWTEFRAID